MRRSCATSARNAGESAIWLCPAQPSAEIVRVERVKCRRECDLALCGATLCGDRACRGRETQARVRFVPVAGKPLRSVSSARNAGESAICPGPGQPALCGDRACRVREMQARVRFVPVRDNRPSAEIVRVECAKCRRECDLSRSRATFCGDRARRVREMQARVRFVPVAGNPGDRAMLGGCEGGLFFPQLLNSTD